MTTKRHVLTVLILEESGIMYCMFSVVIIFNVKMLHCEDLSRSGYVEFILQHIFSTSSKFKVFLFIKYVFF